MRTATYALIPLFALTTPALAGDLTPPAGPVSETMKTLDEVEARIPLNADTAPSFGFGVFAITQPGSYYLTDNITLPGNRIIGVRILADNVTLDLNGYTISGHPTAQAGVSASVASRGITVRNGVIEEFPQGLSSGVDLSIVTNARILDVTVKDANIGFFTGADAIVERCVADGAGEVGFDLGARSIIRQSRARGGAFAGFSFPGGGTAIECSTAESARGVSATGGLTLIDSAINGTTTGNGVEALGGEVVIRGCRITDVGNWGIVVTNSASATIEDTTLENIGGVGVNLSSSTDGRVDGCVIRNTSLGGVFSSAARTHVTDTIVDTTGGDGIKILSGMVSGCTVANAGDEGIEAFDDSRIENNVVESPAGNGIYTTNNCSIIGNTITNPPGGTPGVGYGINPAGGGNLVDSNHVTLDAFQSFGGILRSGGDRNVIVRNVMVNTGIAFSGTPTGSLVGPDDDITSPWANFTR